MKTTSFLLITVMCLFAASAGISAELTEGPAATLLDTAVTAVVQHAEKFTNHEKLILVEGDYFRSLLGLPAQQVMSGGCDDSMPLLMLPTNTLLTSAKLQPRGPGSTEKAPRKHSTLFTATLVSTDGANRVRIVASYLRTPQLARCQALSSGRTSPPITAENVRNFVDVVSGGPGDLCVWPKIQSGTLVFARGNVCVGVTSEDGNLHTARVVAEWFDGELLRLKSDSQAVRAARPDVRHAEGFPAFEIYEQ